MFTSVTGHRIRNFFVTLVLSWLQYIIMAQVFESSVSSMGFFAFCIAALLGIFTRNTRWPISLPYIIGFFLYPGNIELIGSRSTNYFMALVITLVVHWMVYYLLVSGWQNAKTKSTGGIRVQIHGKPGANLKGFGGRAGDWGAVGERKAVQQLATELKDAKLSAHIFVGLEMFPGSQKDDDQRDLDVAIYVPARHKVYCVDVKNYKAGLWSVTDRDEITHMVTEESRAMSIANTAARYQKHGAGYGVHADKRGFICLLSPDGYEVMFHNRKKFEDELVIGDAAEIVRRIRRDTLGYSANEAKVLTYLSQRRLS